jgi:hypothetical protein
MSKWIWPNINHNYKLLNRKWSLPEPLLSAGNLWLHNQSLQDNTICSIGAEQVIKLVWPLLFYNVAILLQEAYTILSLLEHLYFDTSES